MDNELKRLREQIDRADAKLLDALSERMKVVDKIAEYKEEKEGAVQDEKREGEILSARIASGRNRNLEGEMVRDIFGTILDFSKRRQKRS